MSDPLRLLEEWYRGHKARCVTIEVSNGYAPTCWQVTLHGRGGKKVVAAEVSFYTVPRDQVPPEVVYVVPPDVDLTDEEWDWPGLGPVILAALARAEDLGL